MAGPAAAVPPSAYPYPQFPTSPFKRAAGPPSHPHVQHRRQRPCCRLQCQSMHSHYNPRCACCRTPFRSPTTVGAGPLRTCNPSSPAFPLPPPPTPQPASCCSAVCCFLGRRRCTLRHALVRAPVAPPAAASLAGAAACAGKPCPHHRPCRLRLCCLTRGCKRLPALLLLLQKPPALSLDSPGRNGWKEGHHIPVNGACCEHPGILHATMPCLSKRCP